jgi:DNA repair exonuclease SbcCD ATPase subunit
MIKFKDIEIQGFGSIVNPLKFKLNRNGLNLMRGRVGSGKTSIPSAMVWCIYGSSLKAKSSIESWEEVRPEDYKGTKVELVFTTKSKYRIVRCHKYKGKVGGIKGNSGLFIFKDNELVHSERNKADKQKYIEELIGYSHTLFMNSIVFGQRMKKIIEETGPIKKKMFEEAFEVTFIEEARLSTKDSLDKSKSLSSKLYYKKEGLEERVNELVDDYKDAKETEKQFTKRKNERKQQIVKSLEAEELDKVNIEKNIASVKVYDLSKLEIQKEKLIKETKANNKNQDKYDDLLKEIKEVEDDETKLTNMPDSDIKKCITCGTELSFKKSKQLTKDRLVLLELLGKKAKKLRKTQFEFTLIDSTANDKELKQIEKKEYANDSSVRLLKSYKDNLLKCQRRVGLLKEDAISLDSEVLVKKSKKLKKKITKVKAKIEVIKNEKAQIDNQLSIEEWLIKDPLSNKGLKAYIFDNLLDKVNTFLSEYSNTLGFRVEFGIDLQSNMKDFYQTITRGDIIIMYEDLSGGQKQLVDTAVALAIHSVISSIKPINVLFLDEPFEGLDDETIDTVSQLIEQKSKKQCLFIITHHTSFHPTTANIIRMKLTPEGHTVVL